MKLVLSWMREFAAVPAEADATAVASRLASCGFEVAEVTPGPDPAVDFEITANRPDCLSVTGLAREAAVAFGVPFAGTADRQPPAGKPSDSSALTVDVQAPDLCPRYSAQVASVNVGPSPAWLADRLHAAGVRAINNVVDVTNYVMLERGQPIHAFDLDRLAGRTIVVRRAKAGERLRTLDGIDRVLDPDMLVIADAERATAVAGVMGGGDSEVSAGTTRIAVESAYFQAAAVRRAGRRLGLKTEASARFERGADPQAPVAALLRVVELLEAIGAGRPDADVIDRLAPLPAPRALTLRASRLTRLLGMEVPAHDVERILAGLGFQPGLTGEGTWQVTVPSWRVDVQREADLIEEVGRHYGYDRLPMTFPPMVQGAGAPDPRIARDHLARQVLRAAGFSEAVTFTFTDRRAAEAFVGSADHLASIANPLSEKFTTLRPSLLPGLLEALAHNRRRQRTDVRLFEAGACFTSADGEHRKVAFAWVGGGTPEHWSAATRPVDFYDARGVAETLCAAYGVPAEFVPATAPGFVEGRTAAVVAGSAALGVVGQLQPALAASRDVPVGESIYSGELDLDALGRIAAGDRQVQALPRFPSIVRDLSILVPDGLPAADVRGTIRSAAPPTLVGMGEFDRYQGKGIPEGRISLSYHLTFRAPDRTLTDAEVDTAMSRIVAALEQRDVTRR